MARYIMTARRKAALRKAQLASARKRRKGVRARRQPLKQRTLSKIQGKNPHSRRATFVAEKSARYSKAGRKRAKQYGSSPYHRSSFSGQFHSRKKARRKKILVRGGAAIGAAGSAALFGTSIAIAHSGRKRGRR